MTTVLRPMSTGEILDRTFALYRRNFKLFAGISAVPGAFYFLFSLLMLLVSTGNPWASKSGATGAAALVASSVSAFIGLIAYLISTAVSQAATAFAVSAVHLEKPTTIGECYARVKGRYGRMVNVIISVYLRVFGVIILSYLALFSVLLIPGITRGSESSPFVVAIVGIVAFIGIIVGIVLGIRLFARYSLAVPACALEDLKARPAMKRSVFLTKGSVGKILAIYILVVLITMAVSFAVTLPLIGFVAAAKTTLAKTLLTILQEFATFIVTAVVGPLATIALSVVYYDERVRKEAFDIQYLMEAANAGIVPVAPVMAVGGAASANA